MLAFGCLLGNGGGASGSLDCLLTSIESIQKTPGDEAVEDFEDTPVGALPNGWTSYGYVR